MEDFVMGDSLVQETGADTLLEDKIPSSVHAENGFVNPNMLLLVDNDEMQTESMMKGESTPESPQYVESINSVTILEQTPRSAALKPTGCCYDDRMTYHSNTTHDGEPHPELPARISAIMDAFKAAKLVHTGSEDELAAILAVTPHLWMYRIRARLALKSELCLVHKADQIAWVESLQFRSPEEMSEMSRRMDTGRKSLYVGPMTTQAALLAAGGAIDTCKHVVEGHVKNAIAIIRPPGHHAEADESMGFCLFNNVPVAARVCQIDYPDKCQKVLILDWDVHHGNGTQNMFYGDGTVLYISLHVYEEGMFYPGQPEDPSIPDGDYIHVGSGDGAGKNINIPWHAQGMGDAEYLLAFQKIIMPVAMEFDPDLVIISAGFDAAEGDQLGGCHVTPNCYAHMTHMLMGLAGGKVAVCLEGGYDLDALQNSATAVAKTLMGEPPPKIEVYKPHYKADEVINRVLEAHAPYWDCLSRYRIPESAIDDGTIRIHDVIRKYQYMTLQERYEMVPVYILRENLYKSFEYEVLATPNVDKAKKVLLILHDP